ncbi:signal peptidase I [Dysgonomonas sp. Marseille-P4677]|uniref:signal peptidase I n=1 Tax=Dysgonomonas sp. Marseille-P4677 TaxID=2364790 RepID=UPI0019117A72|nr:signal peptidase I [Dysgonomonas sp. Marseille-P4677]MBK5721088.1 signal peptidase I [Dysgonomonas sp. Marseille-P4677]
MSSKKRNIYIYLGKVILITLLIVLFIRGFIISSFSVSSSQMETTLHNGDKILINKTAYGIRLPITPLSVPFTFDNFWGLPSYSSVIQIPYYRLFENNVEQNDIVLFNTPWETEKPLDKRSLLLSRCVALPGDTIEVRNDTFLINGNVYEATPNRIQEYWIKNGDKAEVESVSNEQNIPIYNLVKRGDTLFTQLSRYDAFILSENLQDTLRPLFHFTDTIKSYKITLPTKGQSINTDENNLVIYRQIILQEQQGENVKIENNKLLINNIEQNKYTFKDSYYWMLSDNTANSIDSRTLGFIPFQNIIGKASYIWYSPAADRTHTDFCLIPIK